MSPPRLNDSIQIDSLVRIQDRDDLGVGQVVRITEAGGVYQADVVFEQADGRRLNTFPLKHLILQHGDWKRVKPV